MSEYSDKPLNVEPVAGAIEYSFVDEAKQRVKVCAIAKTFLNTPYRDHGRIRGAGVDCASLLICVYGPEGAGVIPAIDPGFYKMHEAFLKRGGDVEYLKWILKFAREIKESEVMPGDLVMYKVGRGFSHGAIVIEWPNHIIHATKTIHGVISSHATREGIFLKRERRFFSHWGKV
jgi:cell wall-associated NlpC family hydrolase